MSNDTDVFVIFYFGSQIDGGPLLILKFLSNVQKMTTILCNFLSYNVYKLDQSSNWQIFFSYSLENCNLFFFYFLVSNTWSSLFVKKTGGSYYSDMYFTYFLSLSPLCNKQHESQT